VSRRPPRVVTLSWRRFIHSQLLALHLLCTRVGRPLRS
jgi:hypothetical protein